MGSSARRTANQGFHEHLTQPLDVDPSILQRFIHAGPPTLKEHRQRQFGNTVGLRLTQEGIAHLKQRILAPFKAVIHLLTNLFQCVKVHLRNAPFDNLLEHYALGLAFSAS